ncbi:MAG TPA: nitroreductase family protein [Proteiniclasticum sp.]|nr:nitroreductase family protein [Proteiniclasticum sp.]
MDTVFKLPVNEVIEKRKSVRTFLEKPLSDQDKKELQSYMETLENPFGVEVKFSFLETGEKKKALGTYGVIKGTVDYIGAAVKKGPFALEALGYEMEKLILYAASKEIGTCWLGGTFKREDFKKAMDIEDGFLFPAITPVGYPKDAKSLTDNLVRFIAKGDLRKPWEELFFRDDFSQTLSEEEAKEYKDVLEMVRMGPSASNKQPWRVLRGNGSFHFYEAKSVGYSDAFPYDIQEIDLGIALCHFHLTAIEKKLSGKITVETVSELKAPENYRYCFSWSVQ